MSAFNRIKKPHDILSWGFLYALILGIPQGDLAIAYGLGHVNNSLIFRSFVDQFEGSFG